MPEVKTASAKTTSLKTSGSKLKDELLYCENCGISFLWAMEEQKSATQASEPRASQPHTCPTCRLLLPTAQRERGLVKWFNPRKHFGFIVRRNADEIFAPAAEIKERAILKEGDLVEFSVGTNERGAIAQEIRLLKAVG